ncbi:GNAT family N-acetyltransferase [Actinokineospora inagensis]|uniref:GNAT family N-acetyltransferase n=1 Tax=Actinokineospora inagensis TaxID=103730 RepID=UPI00042017C4|nr:GNAT family N-acetyltransferase [Actinokineospora inagensis]
MSDEIKRPRFDVIMSQGGAEIIDATFRSARSGDATAMYELSKPFVATGGLIARDLELFDTDVEELYVVEIDRKVVACAGIRRFTDLAEIFNVVVDARWQSLGIGRFLLASMLIVLESAGFADAVVFTKTTRDWFARYGFVPMDPAPLPAGRLAMLDPERKSIPMVRPTVRAEDGIDALAGITELRVRFERSGLEVVWDSGCDSLLFFAEKHDIETASLCQGGVCGTCSSPLKQGTVSYHVRPEVDPGDGSILLCISRPAANLVLDL